MQLIFNIDGAHFSLEFNNTVDNHDAIKEFAIVLYNIIPPTSVFYEPMIKHLSLEHKEIYRELGLILKNEEPIIPPETVF